MSQENLPHDTHDWDAALTQLQIDADFNAIRHADYFEEQKQKDLAASVAVITAAQEAGLQVPEEIIDNVAAGISLEVLFEEQPTEGTPVNLLDVLWSLSTALSSGQSAQEVFGFEKNREDVVHYRDRALSCIAELPEHEYDFDQKSAWIEFTNSYLSEFASPVLLDTEQSLEDFAISQTMSDEEDAANREARIELNQELEQSLRLEFGEHDMLHKAVSGMDIIARHAASLAKRDNAVISVDVINRAINAVDNAGLWSSFEPALDVLMENGLSADRFYEIIRTMGTKLIELK